MKYLCPKCEYVLTEIGEDYDYYNTRCPICNTVMKPLKNEKYDEKLDRMMECIKQYGKYKIWDIIEKKQDWHIRTEQRRYFFKALDNLGLKFEPKDK